MAFSFRRLIVTLSFAAGAGLVVGAGACGASINVLYESDVRFEHCMALDEQASEMPSARKECWDEWAEYYTFGQTRDRVDYARLRRKQLAGGDQSPEPAASTAEAQRVVPEPTTVLAPPPMMIVDAGADTGAVDAAPPPPEPPAAACANQCRDAWVPCKEACSTAACEKKCVTTYKRCMRRCY
ncbi:MAG: hypothetical protein R3B70_09115 [Polyangiaceae bacterium]